MTIAGSVAGTGRLLAVGLSHKTAPIEDREKAALNDRLARPVLRALGDHPAVSEAVALSTCNRTELYAVVQDPGAGETALRGALREHTSIDTRRLECALYTLHEEKVAAHLFRVASGLDSMVVGESEIQGQVRAAAELAAEERLLGPVLGGVYRHALAAGKRVRRETRVGAGTISISSVAVDLARQTFHDLAGRRAVLIGAGKTAEATARALLAGGLPQLVVANRTASTARALAAHFDGRGVGFERLRDELKAADIVISSTDAPHRILRRADVGAVMGSRRGRALVIIDIALPRDVEAATKSLPGVTLYDVDDLEQVAETNRGGRRREAERAEGIIREELCHYRRCHRAAATTPTVRALWAWAESLRQSEIAELERRSGSLAPETRRQLEVATQLLVEKLLREPTTRLRSLGDRDDGLRHLESLRYLFGLDAAEDGPAADVPAASATGAADSRRPPDDARCAQTPTRPTRASTGRTARRL
jgi:glutamyl-tRNA reductase